MNKRLDIHNSEIPVVCQACEARHRGVCGALNPEELQKLSKHTRQRVVASDSELVAAGEEITTYANIMHGVVKLTKLLADGRQQVVGLQFAPDFLGRPFKRDGDTVAEAATDVGICSFPRDVLEDIVAESPQLRARLHAQALRELDEARDWLLTLGRKTATEKVASFLLLIATHVDPVSPGEDAPIRFELPLKRADIADFLGLTIETVSRQITKLRKSGVIEVENNRTITVPDVAALEHVSEPD